MVVQHNMTAMYSNRTLHITTGNLEKNTEKLSSGYRINRAADDVAGLAISEKMRGQIKGLEKSSKNAQDAISLVQTAEGATNEIHSVLQRMRELCVQASNDTNTDDDRSQIELELDQLGREVDRIANTTEFNGMKLINGDYSLKAQDTKTRIQEYLKGSWIPNAMTRIQDATGLSLNGNITMKVVFEDLGSGVLAAMQGNTGYGSKDFTLKINSTVLESLSLDDFTTSSGPAIGGILCDRVITHEFLHAVEFNNFCATVNPPLWFIEGLAEAVQGNHRTFPQDTATAQNNIVSGDEYEQGYYAVSYMQYNGDFSGFLDSLGSISFNDALKKYYGEDSAADFITKITTLATNDINSFLAAAHVTLADGLDDAIIDWDAAPKDVNPSGGGVLAIEDHVETMNMGNASCTITWADFNYERNGMRLQVGANSGQEIELNMGNLKSKELFGSEDIDVSTHSAAAASITRFDGAIKTLSFHRAKLGAIQNRLEHAIQSLNNSAENLQSSESKIRDTDITEEMVKYSNNNILVNAGQSMLAQANQSTRGVLSLLQ